MTVFQACAALWALLAAAPALAQVYKCEQAGKVSYSDSPCPGAGAASRPLTLKVDASPTLGESSDVRVRHYDVNGLTHQEVVRSIAARGPKGFHALATWKPSYQFWSTREGSQCRVSRVQLHLEADILMPRWVDAARAPAELVRRWDRHYAALMLHEQGHIQHGREFGVIARKAIMGLPPVPCEEIQARVERLFAELSRDYGDRDADYDRRTNHGQTQGAVF